MQKKRSRRFFFSYNHLASETCQVHALKKKMCNITCQIIKRLEIKINFKQFFINYYYIKGTKCPKPEE